MRPLIACALVGSLLGQPANAAGLPVIDAAALFKWAQQAQQMDEQLQTTLQQLHSLTDVPQDLIQQVEGLLQQAVANPLGDIQGNIQALLTGHGTGSCGGAQTILDQNQYAAPEGSDFMGMQQGAAASRNAGLQACTQQMMTGTQTRLTQMPQLLNQLQGAHDITQVSAVSARIQYENAVTQAQNLQLQSVATSAMLQQQAADQQIQQKMRADSLERAAATSGAGAPAGGIGQAPIPAPQPFMASGG